MATPRSVETEESVDLSDGVTVTQLSRGDRLQGQYVDMAPDSRVDTHAHPHEQLTFVVEGKLTLVVDGEESDLSPGDSLIIPGGAEHAAITDGQHSAVAFDVFSPPRDGLPDVE